MIGEQRAETPPREHPAARLLGSTLAAAAAALTLAAFWELALLAAGSVSPATTASTRGRGAAMGCAESPAHARAADDAQRLAGPALEPGVWRSQSSARFGGREVQTTYTLALLPDGSGEVGVRSDLGVAGSHDETRPVRWRVEGRVLALDFGEGAAAPRQGCRLVLIEAGPWSVVTTEATFRRADGRAPSPGFKPPRKRRSTPVLKAG